MKRKRRTTFWWSDVIGWQKSPKPETEVGVGGVGARKMGFGDFWGERVVVFVENFLKKEEKLLNILWKMTWSNSCASADDGDMILWFLFLLKIIAVGLTQTFDSILGGSPQCLALFWGAKFWLLSSHRHKEQVSSRKSCEIVKKPDRISVKPNFALFFFPFPEFYDKKCKIFAKKKGEARKKDSWAQFPIFQGWEAAEVGE